MNNQTQITEQQELTELMVVNSNQNDEKMMPISIQKQNPLEVTMWNDTSLFNQAFKMAKIVAESDIVPPSYRGKTGNCLLAIDIANRMGLSPLSVMQNSQVVQNKFSWTGSACKSMIDNCGKYKKTKYVMVGERGTDGWGYYLQATEKDGTIVDGVCVTVQMAKDEGWYARNPKWKTITELMLKYRAAAFFMRTECASLSMGFLSAEENEDVYFNENKKSDLKSALDAAMKGE